VLWVWRQSTGLVGWLCMCPSTRWWRSYHGPRGTALRCHSLTGFSMALDGRANSVSAPLAPVRIHPHAANNTPAPMTFHGHADGRYISGNQGLQTLAFTHSYSSIGL